MAKTILEYDTVSLDEESGALVIIDQTQLPGKIEPVSYTHLDVYKRQRQKKP